MKYKRTTKTEKQEVRLTHEEKDLIKQATAQSVIRLTGVSEFWRAATMFVSRQVVEVKAGRVTPEMAACGFREFVVSLIDNQEEG